jgi:hypothetical protein
VRLTLPHSRILAAAVLVAAEAGCLPALGRPPGPTAPPAGSDADVVFQQIASIRRAQGATPPTWVGRLVPIAQDAAARIAGGANDRGVANDASTRAAYSIGRNVEIWYMISDSLYGMEYSPRLVSGHSLMLAIGVALMQRGGAGRYVIVTISPEPGQSL